MTSLETVVRPVSYVTTTPTRTTIPQLPARDPVLLSFGESGNSIWATAIFPYEFTTDTKGTEISRTVDIVRIANQDNPDQFVDVESVKKNVVKGDDGVERTTTFAPFTQAAGPGSTMSVIKKDITIVNTAPAPATP